MASLICRMSIERIVILLFVMILAEGHGPVVHMLWNCVVRLAEFFIQTNDEAMEYI
jgi:hypothetical protein